jgi:hypothetical protein
LPTPTYIDHCESSRGPVRRARSCKAERPAGEAALEADVVAGLLTVFFSPAVLSPI